MAMEDRDDLSIVDAYLVPVGVAFAVRVMSDDQLAIATTCNWQNREYCNQDAPSDQG